MDIFPHPAKIPTMETITFTPLYMERVWGGRQLETTYNRQLPDPHQPYGESWEICDRPNETSIVSHGTFKGKTLSEIWQNNREEIFGVGFENLERFPLLIKILDARDKLSIQVHPPADIAPDLGGEPKTEMWYIADTTPNAQLYAGIKRGVTQTDFEKAINQGTVDQVVHAIDAQPGDSIFIPSGRLHAIGAGFLIYEIQQNSDTTYRVFDWNRLGLDGKPRELHIEESMRCIDFNDIEPSMDTPSGPNGHTLATCPHFQVDQLDLPHGTSLGNPDSERFSIVTVISGQVRSSDGRLHNPGDFLLQPRNAPPLTAQGETKVLQTTIPR